MRLKRPKKPAIPHAPVKPEKESSKRIDNSKEFSNINDFFDHLISKHGDVKLSDTNLLKDLDGYHIDYSLDYSSCYYESDTPSVETFIKFLDIRRESYENPNYEKQRRDYLDAYAKYKKDKAIYKEELTKYNYEMAKYKEEISRRAVEKAEKVIKSNSKKT